jgi:Mn2+/Fe2+ NRAMP family transporter
MEEDEKGWKSQILLYLAVAAVMIVFAVLIVLCYLSFKDDPDLLTMSMCALSSALTFVVLVFAVLIMRKRTSASEEYQRLYGKKE